MNFMMVEPINTKFSAYHFDGTKESALEAVEKWDCIMSSMDNSDKYKLILKDGQDVRSGDYIVIKDNKFFIYTQDEFISKYRIVYDMRDRIGSFYSID